MIDLIDRYQNLVKTGFEYAEQGKGSAPTSNFEIYMGHFASLFSEIHTALSEAEQRAKETRREALEEAAKVVENTAHEGMHASMWRGKFMSAASRIRALIPSEPHDAEGRE